MKNGLVVLAFVGGLLLGAGGASIVLEGMAKLRAERDSAQTALAGTYSQFDVLDQLSTIESLSDMTVTLRRSINIQLSPLTVIELDVTKLNVVAFASLCSAIKHKDLLAVKHDDRDKVFSHLIAYLVRIRPQVIAEAERRTLAIGSVECSL